MTAGLASQSWRGLAGVLAVAWTGTRVSAIALPWFVLTATGSAVQTGIVAFVEMAPYVVCQALLGPVIDRAGPRRISIAAVSRIDSLLDLPASNPTLGVQ
jgi:MFS family permease